MYRVLGSEGCRQRDGAATSNCACLPCRRWLISYASKLEYELGYKYCIVFPMQMHNKVTIFDMVFAMITGPEMRSCATCTTGRLKEARDDAGKPKSATAEGVRGPWRDGLSRWRTSCPGFERWANSVGAVASMGSTCTRLVSRGSGFLISISGISSQQRPSVHVQMPLLIPPHCLKKNGTSAAGHRYREYGEPHCGSIGRKFGPDSPPAITINRELQIYSVQGPVIARRGEEHLLLRAPVS